MSYLQDFKSYLLKFIEMPWMEVTLPLIQKSVVINFSFVLQIFLTFISFSVVIKTAQRKRYGWALNIAKKSLGLTLYFLKGLYVKCTLDLILIGKSFYGWYAWGAKKDSKDKKPLSVTALSWQAFFIYYVGSIVAGLLLGYIYGHYLKADKSYLDGLHATMSIINYYLLAKRKREAWLFCLTGQVLYIHVCYTKGMFFFFKYLVYAVLSIRGLYQWDQTYKLSKEPNNV